MKVLSFLFILSTALAWPEIEVEKREYKTMLKASLFNGHPPCADNIPIISTLEGEISRRAFSSGSTPSGSFSLKKGMPRTVRFYDTPGTCRLKSNGWVFRVRQESGKGTLEGTFKSRSGDRYYSTYRRKYMNSCCRSCTDLGGKFEEDLNLNWQSRFSYSHKCGVSIHRSINSLEDIADHWHEMKPVFEQIGWGLDTPIRLVSGLTVTECVYKGLVVDFDKGGSQEIGKFAVTLWYPSPTAANPALAEVSFKLKSTGKNLEDWNEHTIVKAHEFWDLCSTLSLVDLTSSTKTTWAYNFDPKWCV